MSHIICGLSVTVWITVFESLASLCTNWASFYTVIMSPLTAYNLSFKSHPHFSSKLCETWRQQENEGALYLCVCACVCMCVCTSTGAHVLPSNYSARELKPLQCPFNSVNYHNHVFLSSLTSFSPPLCPLFHPLAHSPLFLYWCFCSNEVIAVCTHAHTHTHTCTHTLEASHREIEHIKYLCGHSERLFLPEILMSRPW